jgi:hypothetical protein
MNMTKLEHYESVSVRGWAKYTSYLYEVIKQKCRTASLFKEGWIGVFVQILNSCR